MENTELSVKELLLNSVTNKRAFLGFDNYYNHFFSTPDLGMVCISCSLLSCIIFLLPLIFRGRLSSAHQTDLTAGNFYPHHSGST